MFVVVFLTHVNSIGSKVPTAAKSRFKRALDTATGRHYWYDRETRETFWTDPTAMPLKTAPEDPRKRRKSERETQGGIAIIALSEMGDTGERLVYHTFQHVALNEALDPPSP